MTPPAPVTVAVLTFRRPDLLAACLEGIVAGVERLETSDPVRVLVVDNDPEGSARAVAHAARPIPVDYVIEQRPGIAAARNRALRESADQRFLAFVDDDEVPDPTWLGALLATRAAFRADAVAGRLISLLPDDVDPWVREGGFFDRPEHPTGTRLDAAASFNLLLDLDALRARGLEFDEGLGLSGGEDTILTTRLTRSGGVLVACAESIAYDRIVPERLTRRWLRRRAFAQGTVLADIRLRLAEGFARRTRVRLTGIAGGLARAALGLAAALVGIVLADRRRRVRGVRTGLRGAGVLARSLGYRHRTYRRAS